MNDTQLNDILEVYNHKIEEAKTLNLQSWVLNLQCFETLQKQKAKSKLKSLINFKIVAIVLGILWMLFLGDLFFHSLEMSRIFFLISCGAIMIFTIIAIAVYLYHIILIDKINNSENVVQTQESIARLQLSTINVTRILFLQTPFYCTFWWSVPMIKSSPLSYWLISFPIALLLTFVAIWLYKNISIRNANKRWFGILFNSPEWTNLVKANIFLEEINSFKKEM